jgi:hypothetical protein
MWSVGNIIESEGGTGPSSKDATSRPGGRDVLEGVETPGEERAWSLEEEQYQGKQTEVRTTQNHI